MEVDYPLTPYPIVVFAASLLLTSSHSSGNPCYLLWCPLYTLYMQHYISQHDMIIIQFFNNLYIWYDTTPPYMKVTNHWLLGLLLSIALIYILGDLVPKLLICCFLCSCLPYFGHLSYYHAVTQGPSSVLSLCLLSRVPITSWGHTARLEMSSTLRSPQLVSYN